MRYTANICRTIRITLLYEVREDQWYRFDGGAVDEIWRIRQEAQEHGYWTIIRNTAV
jgi:hypothetical protein